MSSTFPPVADCLLYLLAHQGELLNRQADAEQAADERSARRKEASGNVKTEADAEFAALLEKRRADNAKVSTKDIDTVVARMNKFEKEAPRPPLRAVGARINLDRIPELVDALRSAFTSSSKSLDQHSKDLEQHDLDWADYVKRTAQAKKREELEAAQALLAKKQEEERLLDLARKMATPDVKKVASR
jgi:CHASE3 domain sensor protein